MAQCTHKANLNVIAVLNAPLEQYCVSTKGSSGDLFGYVCTKCNPDWRNLNYFGAPHMYTETSKENWALPVNMADLINIHNSNLTCCLNDDGFPMICCIGNCVEKQTPKRAQTKRINVHLDETCPKRSTFPAKVIRAHVEGTCFKPCKLCIFDTNPSAYSVLKRALEDEGVDVPPRKVQTKVTDYFNQKMKVEPAHENEFTSDSNNDEG